MTEKEERLLLLEERLRSYPVRLRFTTNVNRNGPIPLHRPGLGPCHLWTQIPRKDGYGQFRVRLGTYGQQALLAHRVSFFIAEGRWPNPHALHRCDNKACVRRSHLFEGTQADNMADMTSKGRRAYGVANGMAKLTDDAVVAILQETGTTRAVAAKYGVSQMMISLIRRGKAWAHVTRPQI